MERHVLFLLSSARPAGNTQALARQAASGLRGTCDWVDLAQVALPGFADPRPAPMPPPEGALADILGRMTLASDIVFAAPVYWYALPAPAKLLLDHWSGFLDAPGLNFAAMMRGKRLWLITVRADPDPAVPVAMEQAMERTAAWLGMVWGGALHGLGDAPGDVCADASWHRAPDFLTL